MLSHAKASDRAVLEVLRRLRRQSAVMASPLHRYTWTEARLPMTGGIGATLVEATKREALCHSVSEGVHLITEAVENLAFYERRGFEILKSRPAYSIRTWSMVWRSR